VTMLIGSTASVAQPKKPKVALVLSGGGAQGIAHIPLLQALDSLGIVPDLVVGTSMGSVVGGLYAMGYSGDSIAHIARSTDWDELLGGQMQLNNVSVEEKSEFNRYTLDFDLVNKKLKSDAFLLNDQNLRQLLAELTFPAYNIEQHFDSLPIPFRSVAVDIVKGEQVIIETGPLDKAIRASMSIPGIFEPVVDGDAMLIDGGAFNNFPVNVAKDLGADIVIGSDANSSNRTVEELNSIATILSQTIMMRSNQIYPENKVNCDIHINHIPNLTYSVADFNKNAVIIEEGKTAVNENMDQLLALAEDLKPFKQRTHYLPETDEAFELDTIIFQNVSKQNMELVMERADISPHGLYTLNELSEGIRRTMGTNLFKKIEYASVADTGVDGLVLIGFEQPKHRTKAALHFDLYRGIGLTTNYSGRNVLGKASRIILNLHIAEQPRFLAQYQKNFTPRKNWWWRSEVSGARLTQKVFVKGENVDNMRDQYFRWDNQVNRNLNSLNSFVGTGIRYQYNDVQPTVSPELKENSLQLNHFYVNYLEVSIHYTYNSLNRVFYPSKGQLVQLKLSRSLVHDVKLNFSDNREDLDGQTNNFFKVQLNIDKRIPVSRSITGIVKGAAGFVLEDELASDELPIYEFQYPSLYSIGGNQFTEELNRTTFKGLREDELYASQFMSFQAGIQYRVIDQFYVTPHANLAWVGFNDFRTYFEELSELKSGWEANDATSLVTSIGTTVSYNSLIGPIDLDASWINDINKIRLSLSIGIPFNK